MFDKLRLLRWVGLAAAAPLGACASGAAVETLAPPTGAEPVTGVPYYLPLASVPLTLVGQPGKAASANPPGATGATGAAGAGATGATGATGAAGAGATGATDAAQPQPYVVTVTLGAPQYRPDPTELHFLKYTHDAWADDTQSLHVDQTGLLTSVTMTSTDQTSAVLQSLAQLAGQIAEAPIAFATPVGALAAFARVPGAGAKVACDLPPYSWMTMLPAAAFTNTIQAAAGDPQSVRIDVQTQVLNAAGAASHSATAHGVPQNGVFFRTPVAYELDVTVTPSPDAIQDCGVLPGRTQQFVALPNDGAVFVEDMSRAAAVKKAVSLTVQNGMLIGVDPSHPSDANGYAQIPVSIMTTLLSIPSNLLTLHVQQLQSEGNLTAAQAAVLQNEINVLTNQAALTKAQAAAQAAR